MSSYMINDCDVTQYIYSHNVDDVQQDGTKEYIFKLYYFYFSI